MYPVQIYFYINTSGFEEYHLTSMPASLGLAGSIYFHICTTISWNIFHFTL